MTIKRNEVAKHKKTTEEPNKQYDISKKPTAALKEILEWSERLPPKFEFENLEAAVIKAYSEKFGNIPGVSLEFVIKFAQMNVVRLVASVFGKVKETLPLNIRSVITEMTPLAVDLLSTHPEPERAILLRECRKYLEIAESCQGLRVYANRLQIWRNYKLPYMFNVKDVYDDDEMNHPMTDYPIPELRGTDSTAKFGFMMVVHTNFQIDFIANPITRAIKGNDGRRIRICNFCEKVFWAYRFDKLGCSNSCNTALRMRNYRLRKKNAAEKAAAKKKQERDQWRKASFN